MSKRFILLFSSIIIILSFTNLVQAQIITENPHTQGVIEGSTATFSVHTTGGTSFQWYLNNTPIGGGTDSSYTTPATTLASDGNEYTVIVSDGVNPDDTSDIAILYVTASGSRVTGGQTVLYNFDEGSGTTINDASGFGSPHNLTINNPSKVLWSPVGLLVKDGALIKSTSIATKVINAATASNEITVELWVRPFKIRNDRIFVLSQSETEIDFGIETYPPYGNNFVARTTTTNNQGTPGSLDTTGSSTDLIHITSTFSDGVSKIYKDGIEVASENIGGDFSNWNTSARLSLASHIGGNKPWEGIFYLATIFNRALDSTEVSHNFSIGIEVEEAPFITEEPQNKKVSEEITATFKTEAIGNTPLSYQWQKNGVNIPGATDSFYTTPATTLADNGAAFRVVVTNSNGSDTSQNATLEVVAGGLAGSPGGMTHYYKLEESGSPYEDSFGFTDAISSNPPTSETGIVGNSQNFSGTETIDIPDDDVSDWEPGESFSLEFWMKTTATPASVNVAIGRDDASSDLQWWVGYNPDGTVSFQLTDIDNEGAGIGGTGPVVNDGDWHLIASVRDGNMNKNYLYVDGNKIDSASQTYNSTFEGSVEVNIGYLNLAPFYYFNGSLDEVAMYNVALSQSEVQKHYNNGLEGKGYNEVIDAPFELNAEAKFKQVELAWKDSSDNEDGFIIERANLDSVPSAFTVIDSVVADDTSYVDTNVSDTTTYSYRIKAYNSLVESAYSNEDTVTTLLSTISAPNSLIAVLDTPDTTNVVLSWNDNSPNESGFVIQRALGDTSEATVFTNIDTVSADVTAYTDTTTSDTTIYTYRIFAYNADTVSAYSNKAEVTTPIPVELTSFTTNIVNGKVFVTWETATETNNAGFSLQRSRDNLSFKEIAFMEGNGTTTNISVYSYTDKSTLSGKYYYRLKQVDLDGSFHYTESIGADLGVPKEFALDQNYPNPFNPSTTIRFALPMSAKVSIKLYNTLGQEVESILSGEMDAGIHERIFNASRLSSGVYFYRLEAKGQDGSSFNDTKRMLLIK